MRRHRLALLLLAALLCSLLAGCPRHSSTSDSSNPAAVQSRASATDIVHATSTGKRYHRSGCVYLSKSDIPMSRQDAEARGLTPCKVCKP